MKKTYLCINRTNNYHTVKEYKTKRSTPFMQVANDMQITKIRDTIYDFMYEFEEALDKEYFQAEEELEVQMQALNKKQEALYTEKTLKSNQALEAYVETFQEHHPEYFI